MYVLLTITSGCSMSDQSSLEEALTALKEGKFVIVFDDKNREDEGDLIMAAEKVTPEAVAFFVRYTSGVICMPMLGERLDELRIPLMVADNSEPHRTAFTVSIDYRHGTSTGISAADRAATIRALIDPNSRWNDFSRPGHVFPLRYREGGVLKRAGHTEATIDLALIAGLHPAGILCELVNDDGTMMRTPNLRSFAQQHQIPLISIADIIRYRRKTDKLIHCVSEARLPTRYGEFTAYVYESKIDQIEHLAMVRGNVRDKKDVLVRVHSECLTGDIFGSCRCDCGSQLEAALKTIADEGTGVLIYLRGHEGRGIGLGHKLRAYNLQDKGRDTVEANIELGFPVDSREYGIGAQMLTDLGITTIRLMTNNPAKYGGLSGYDLKIVERVPLTSTPTSENRRYLLTKKDKLGHFIEI
jgi:3,4-dihydroxy 2-butanone 4-phosphate synthase / GTP cyclohydrolase II